MFTKLPAYRYLQLLFTCFGLLISALGYVLIRLMTISYYPRLLHYTVRPIRSVAKHADNKTELVVLLCRFREKKRRDLEFVRLSSSLAAIANTGVFSWPVMESAFWLGKVFWYWSLSLSIFSLISSTIDQLLEWLPSQDQEYMSDDRRKAVLRLLVERNPGASKMSPRWAMVWVWQCPIMLMSWSWVFFYAGLLLHILTPVIPSKETPSAAKIVATTMVGCGLPIVNFFLCSTLTNWVLQKLRETEEL